MASIVAAALWFIGGAVTYLVVTWLIARHQNAFHKFTGFTPRSKARLRVIYGLVVDPSTGHRFAHEGDVSSIASALHFLSLRRRGSISSVCSTTARPDFRTWHELMAISGPVWNDVSKELIASSPFDIAFKTITRRGVNVDALDASGSNGTKFTSLSTVRGADGRPRTCYGLVQVTHERGSRAVTTRHRVVVAGVSTLGTFGALCWLEQLADIDDIPEHDVGQADGIRDRFAIVKVTDSSPDGFFTYGSNSLAPTFLSIELLHLEANTFAFPEPKLLERVLRYAERRLLGEV